MKRLMIHNFKSEHQTGEIANNHILMEARQQHLSIRCHVVILPHQFFFTYLVKHRIFEEIGERYSLINEEL